MSPARPPEGAQHRSAQREGTVAGAVAVAAGVPPAVEATRWVAVGSTVGLLVLCVAWELWLAPLRPGGSWLVVKALPLLFPLPGLWRRRLYTYRWTSLLVWLYVTEGLVRATSERGTAPLLAGLEIVLALALFAACALHARLRLGPR